MKFDNLKTIIVNPEDWDLLKEIALLDQQAFTEDGISIFNLSLFCRVGLVIAVLKESEVVAELVFLKGLNEGQGIVFGISVKDACRKQGIGTYLMQELLTLVKDFNISYIDLTVNPENSGAFKLYKDKFGFELVEDLESHPEKDEPRCLMRKYLK
jgi:ribosomal-protein-alanine N-acetyltransferase